MGAWGVGVFQNDDAADLFELARINGPEVIRKTLRHLKRLSDRGTLEMSDEAAAIAAAGIMVMTSGGRIDNPPDDKLHWNRAFGGWTQDDIDMARLLLERIVNRSELRELWHESEDYAGWKNSVACVVEQLAVKAPRARRLSSKSKLVRPSVGDVYAVDIGEGRLAELKVLWLSKKFRHLMLVGVLCDTNAQIRHRPCPYRALIYTSAQLASVDERWKRIRFEDPSEGDCQLSMRLFGDQVWHGDEYLRAATDADWSKVPQQSVAGSDAVVISIRAALGLSPNTD